MSTLLETAGAVAQLGVDFGGLSDTALLEAQRTVAQHRHAVDVVSAALAGEINRRSARELGYSGLAQASGFLSPAALIQSITGGSRSEAAKHVAVGSALDSLIGAAVLEGRITVDAAGAIQRGLGSSGEAATPLLDDARTLDADQLYRRARDLRDDLDAQSIARREREQRDLRYLRFSSREDGMVRGSFLLDAVDGALLTSALDAVVSPRRGGPRFASPHQNAEDQSARDSALEVDERSTEQIAADSLIGMVRLAVDADPGTLFGSRRPAVRLVVNGDVAIIVDSGERVSTATVERFVCDAGVIGVRFDDDGQCVSSHLKMSAARSACSPSGSGLAWRCGTVDAGSRAVIGRRPGARRITLTSGSERRAALTSPTECCSVAVTTCWCITTAGRWVASARGTGCSRRAGKTGCPCRRRAACSRNGQASRGGGVCPPGCQ